MAKVSVTKKFTMSLDEVKQGMENIVQQLASEHGMKYTWKDDYHVEFSHKTGKGMLHVEGDALILELKISMLYSAAAPVVKKQIHAFADQYIH